MAGIIGSEVNRIARGFYGETYYQLIAVKWKSS